MQVFRREKLLAVSMNDFSKLLEHFTLFRTLVTHGNRLPDDLRLSSLREVSSSVRIKDGVSYQSYCPLRARQGLQGACTTLPMIQAPCNSCRSLREE